jgi:hypothetical protein
MATYNKVKFSGSSSTNAPIVVAFAVGSPTTIHQTGSSTTILDEVWMWLSNTSTTTPDDYKITVNGAEFTRLSLQPMQTILIIPGVPFSGDGSTGTIVGVENISVSGSYGVAYGYVNRITP